MPTSFTHLRRAFTLLEVVLALGLTVIVLGLVGSQVYSTLSLVQRGRMITEREQLARAILHKVSDDLRASVRYEPFDASGMPNFTAASSSSSSQSGRSSSGSGGGSGSSGSSGSGGSNGSGSSGGSGSGSGGGSSGGSGNSGGSGSGSGGGSGGASGSGSGSGSGKSSQSSSTGSSGSGSGSSSDSSSQSQSSTSLQYPGIYGDQYNLQIDVARIPRLDEYNSTDGSTDNTSPQTTDLRTITYYVANSPAPSTNLASGTATTSTSSSSSSSSTASSGSTSSSTTILRSSTAANMSGLVRSELDRAASLWASQQGGGSSLDDHTVAIAPEVADMEFSYFDGTNWNDTWDTTANSGLPQAISISIVLDDKAIGGPQVQVDSPGTVSVADTLATNPEKVYRLVVRLPACDQVQSASSQSSSSSTSSTGGSQQSSGSSNQN